MKETDLFIPVKTLFTSMSYAVQGEVNGIDMMAQLDDTVIMIEFKLQLDFKLVLQAVDRQKITELVYIAIPKPTASIMRSKSYKEKIHLLRRLELGLIYVTINNDIRYAQIIEEPRPYNRVAALSRNKKKKKAALKEMQNRHSEYNIGGTKGKVMTVYKEQALWIAYQLKDAPKSPAQIKSETGIIKTPSILQKNFYNWYERVDRGLYALTDQGLEAITEFSKLIKIICESRPNYE